MAKILFVCTGNTCRSPMAAALYAKQHPEATVASAGIACTSGQKATEAMRHLAPEFGVDLNAHRSVQLSRKMLMSASAVVCLDSAHAKTLQLAVPHERLFVLGGGISDPFGRDDQAYLACAQSMAKALPGVHAAMACAAHIKPASLSHASAFAALEREAFEHPASEQRLAERFAQPTAQLFVATVQRKVVGYLDCDFVAGEAYLQNIAVATEQRRRGIGAALLARATLSTVLQDGYRMHLELRCSNVAALGLYECSGFREAGRRKQFYDAPLEDAFLMTLQLV